MYCVNVRANRVEFSFKSTEACFVALLSKFICEDVDSNVIVLLWTNYVLVFLESRRRLNGFFSPVSR